MKLPEGIGFTADSFDILRKVLRAHLGEVLPERDHRELIINLIDDVKRAARDEANAKFPALFEAFMRHEYAELFAKQAEWNKELTRELFEAWVKREGVRVFMEESYSKNIWFTKKNPRGRVDTHQAYLMLYQELKKCEHFPGQTECMWCKK